MKQIKQLLIALLFSAASFSAAFAGGNSYGQPVDNAAALQERVQDLIHVPVNGRDLNGTLELVFRIDDFGRIEVLTVDGKDTYMTKQVETDLDNQRINVAQEFTGKVFRMKLRYGS